MARQAFTQGVIKDNNGRTQFWEWLAYATYKHTDDFDLFINTWVKSSDSAKISLSPEQATALRDALNVHLGSL